MFGPTRTPLPVPTAFPFASWRVSATLAFWIVSAEVTEAAWSPDPKALQPVIEPVAIVPTVASRAAQAKPRIRDPTSMSSTSTAASDAADGGGVCRLLANPWR